MEMYENGWESDLRCRALRKVSEILTHFVLSLPDPFLSQKEYLESRDTALASNV